MGTSALIHILRFLLVVLAQGLIFNHLDLFGFINPYVYVMFILMLPLQINQVMLLVLAFLTGLSVDLFTQTWGIHAFATVFMAYLRPLLLRLIAPRDGYSFNLVPSIKSMGLAWTGTYLGLLIFSHHLALLMVDMFRFSEFGNLLGRVAGSTLLTLSLILLFQISRGIKSSRE
jgi:rod shape-determining protein MreD